MLGVDHGGRLLLVSSVEVDALPTTGSVAVVAEGGRDRTTTAASPTSTSGWGDPPSRCRHRRGRSPAGGVAPGLGRGIPRLECRRLLQRRVRNRSAQRQSLRRARSGAVGAARRQLMGSPRKTVRPRGRTVSTPASPSGPAAPAGTTDCTTTSPPLPAKKRYASTTFAWTGLWRWPPPATGTAPPSSPAWATTPSGASCAPRCAAWGSTTATSSPRPPTTPRSPSARSSHRMTSPSTSTASPRRPTWS